LPALIVRHGQKEQVNRKMAIASFGLQPILALVQKTPRSVLLTTAAIVALLAYLGSGIKFDDNLRNFRAFDSNVFRLQDKIADWLGGSTASILLIAEDSSEAQVVDTTASIYAALKELNDTGKIAGIQSISRYFPAPDRQRANMAFIKQHAGLFNLRRIKQTFDQALIENGFEILDRYNDYFGHLAKAFAQDQLFLPTALRDKDLKQLLKLFYIQKKGLFPFFRGRASRKPAQKND
jgi:predicted exporter